jgi:hypothetical protein
VDTTATPAEQKGQEPDKQSRRESRAFATLRRENRDLYRRLGGMEAMLAQFSQQGQPPQTDGEQTQQRQTRAPQPTAADYAQGDLNRSLIDRIEEAGEGIEGFDEVMDKITADNFPINVAMRDYLATSDRPAEVAKYLAEHPKEAQQICALGERAADRAMERIEAKLAKAPPKKTTQAPPPVPTVGGRSTAEFDPEKASMEDYAAYWKERQAKRG